MVGVQGFEPWTLCSQSRCATRLRYTPIKTGTWDWTRTSIALRVKETYHLSTHPGSYILSNFNFSNCYLCAIVRRHSVEIHAQRTLAYKTLQDQQYAWYRCQNLADKDA